MFTTTIKERDSINALPLMPASINGASNETGAVDMSKFARVMFVGAVGTLGSSATVDAYLQETNESNGANATNIANAAITTINAANKAFTIECQAPQLTKRYVKCVVNVGTAASIVGVFPIATIARDVPANSYDNAAVVQRIVTPLA